MIVYNCNQLKDVFRYMGINLKKYKEPVLTASPCSVTNPVQLGSATAALSKMVTVFGTYDKEVGELLLSASRAVAAALSPSASLPAASLETADRALLEAGEVIESMSLEAATASGTERASQRERIAVRKRELTDGRSELRDARSRLARAVGEAERDELFGDSDAVAERVRLVEETSALQRGGEHIMDSRRNIAQTEAIGAGILADLQNQRATINRARDTVLRIDDGIDSSHSIITSMNRRAYFNKMVIYGVFAAISLSVVMVMFFRMFPHQQQRDVVIVQPKAQVHRQKFFVD